MTYGYFGDVSASKQEITTLLQQLGALKAKIQAEMPAGSVYPKDYLRDFWSSVISVYASTTSFLSYVKNVELEGWVDSGMSLVLPALKQYAASIYSSYESYWRDHMGRYTQPIGGLAQHVDASGNTVPEYAGVYVVMPDGNLKSSVLGFIDKSTQVVNLAAQDYAIYAEIFESGGKLHAFLAGVSGAVFKLFNLAVTLVRHIPDIPKLADTAVKYAFFAGAAFLGYKLLLSEDAPFKLGKRGSHA